MTYETEFRTHEFDSIDCPLPICHDGTRGPTYARDDDVPAEHRISGDYTADQSRLGDGADAAEE